MISATSSHRRYLEVIGKRGVNPALGIPNERRFIQMALRLSF